MKRFISTFLAVFCAGMAVYGFIRWDQNQSHLALEWEIAASARLSALKTALSDSFDERSHSYEMLKLTTDSAELLLSQKPGRARDGRMPSEIREAKARLSELSSKLQKQFQLREMLRREFAEASESAKQLEREADELTKQKALSNDERTAASLAVQITLKRSEAEKARVRSEVARDRLSRVD